MTNLLVAQPYPVVKEVKVPVEVRVPKPYPVEKVRIATSLKSLFN
jgi:hypothetical protein